MVTYYKDKEGAEDKNNDESYPIFSEFKKYIDYSDAYVKIPSDLNVKDILNLSSKQKCTVLLISRKNTSLPFCDITIRRKKMVVLILLSVKINHLIHLNIFQKF